jgi:hypothetical protein
MTNSICEEEYMSTMITKKGLTFRRVVSISTIAGAPSFYYELLRFYWESYND